MWLVVGHLSDTHFAACFGACLAGFSTTGAMLIVVLAALLGALIADLGAQGTEFMGDAVTDLAIGTRHEGCRHSAEVSAVAVQLDAIGHHFHIGLLQASCGAMFAFVGAGLAGLDAVVVLLMHGVGVVWRLGEEGSENQATNAGATAGPRHYACIRDMRVGQLQGPAG